MTGGNATTGAGAGDTGGLTGEGSGGGAAGGGGSQRQEFITASFFFFDNLNSTPAISKLF
ncbi:MAG TPA: hypothetical protein VKA09_03045 [Nitrososphaeraceae archaeon]|nr:hypothetical protein [Nitrososphaeraceae archaeon]